VRGVARVGRHSDGARRHRPIRVFLVFVAVLIVGFGLAFHFAPNRDVAISAGAAELLFLILLVAAWDLVAMATQFAPYLAWLPQHPVPPWLQPVRSSLVVIAFAYGILLGHFFWQ
jgi:hypothetical protein